MFHDHQPSSLFIPKPVCKHSSDSGARLLIPGINFGILVAGLALVGKQWLVPAVFAPGLVAGQILY